MKANDLDPAVLALVFAFALIGYGTKIGLVPMHAWLPFAHSEGPTPVSAVLSGLLLNVGLYALLRFKMLLWANSHTSLPGDLMIGFGLASLMFAALMLYRCRDIKRLFTYSSIEHMGLITLAFGIGGHLATLAGLLHMALHSLTKSAIFFIVGHVAQIEGTQKIYKIRNLTASHPELGWALVVGVLTISGLPPGGLFMTEFLLVSSTFSLNRVLGVLLVAGLLIAFGAMIWRLQTLAFGGPTDTSAKREQTALTVSLLPPAFNLSLVIVAGLFLPASFVTFLNGIAVMLK